MEGKTILLVEDDIKLLNSNRLLLESEGCHVLSAETLAAARAQLRKVTPDAVVLDIMLPDGSGLDFLSEIRGASPVLLLTSLDTNADMIRGLEAGGDDYLTKPFDVGVFLTRVKAVLRRAGRVPETLTKGALKLSVPSGQAFLNGADMMLTQKEFALLLLFAQNADRVLTTEFLYEKAWGHPWKEDTNAVKFQISRLRKKITGAGWAIVAEYGGGYRFEGE